MTKRQLDYLNMILAVENHFNTHPTSWNSNAPMVASKSILSTKIALLSALLGKQLVDNSGIALDKKSTRAVLERQAFALSATTCAFANIANRADLYARCSYNKTQLSQFRGEELIGHCTTLLASCTAEIANLAPYNVTVADLSNLESAITAFVTLLKKPIEAIAKRKSATAEIQDLIAEITTFLNQRLDNLIVGMQIAQPDFVAIYKNLRTINSAGINKMSLTITSLNAATNEPIANVKIEIVGKATKRVSSPKGHNKVVNLVAGKHKLIATHKDYATKTETFSIVNGKTTKLILWLNRV